MAETTVSNDLNNNHTTDEVSSEASISKECLATSGKENETPSNAHSASLTEQKETQPVTSTSQSASSEPAPKIIAGTVPVRSTTPVVVGARVVPAGLPGTGATSLALVPQPAKVPLSSVAVNPPRVTTLAPGMTLTRISTPTQNVTVARAPQTVPLQLPANFQVPQGKNLFFSSETPISQYLRNVVLSLPHV